MATVDEVRIRYCAKQTIAEIAVGLGVSEKTVRLALKDARKAKGKVLDPKPIREPKRKRPLIRAAGT